MTTYAYDKGNRLTQINDSVSGLITRTYDGLDRLNFESTPQGSITYTDDASGRRATMTVTGQSSVVYSYDNANRLTQITQGTSIVSFGYDNANRRTSLTLPNGIAVEYGYDAASRVTGITYKQNGTTLLGDLTYEYDKAGNRNKVGGSFARTGIPESVSTANYNAGNQQTAFGDKSLTYDNNGNLSSVTDSNGTTLYGWNARNQLAGISGPNVNATFVYDATGRRQKKTINGTLTEFIYDGLNPVQETSGATVLANNLTGLGIDEFLTRTDVATSTTGAFLRDALGSILAMADSAGIVQTENTYEPFGKTTTAGISNSNPFQYTGRENDGTDVYFYRARYYQPSLQRFIGEDPIRFAGGNINLYDYVHDNPLRLTDPIGLATAMCTQPLHALGANGEWAYANNVPLLYHQYLCVTDGKGGYSCGGQDREGGAFLPGSNGKPSDDKWPRKDGPQKCEIVDKRQCVDQCVLRKIGDPRRPWYAIAPWGTDCQEWAQKALRECQEECSWY